MQAEGGRGGRRLGEIRTWSTLEEDRSARGCIVEPSSEVEPRERGEGPVRILSFRRVDEAAGGGRFFGGGM